MPTIYHSLQYRLDLPIAQHYLPHIVYVLYSRNGQFSYVSSGTFVTKLNVHCCSKKKKKNAADFEKD